ncbi:hypothetical protein AMK59_7795 [Oryctes borbonicus]|uniref:Actin maturation protease n=1 Tax=Oryctes borbonicus TaxID=1629725 RepID=A0A0T6ASS1_9SCAR|nr:hypothetical protein AMK59_7795 [Oryctes borbonicus]
MSSKAFKTHEEFATITENVAQFPLASSSFQAMSWAADYPDLYKICELYQRYEILYPKQIKYVPLPALLQDGPQCGLVSLAMFINNTSKDKVKELLEIAKQRRYTYNGEMFSADNLCELTNDFTEYTASIYNGHLNTNYIKDFLLNGGYMLVPYDADKNHSPCLNNGHKAHWAAISGIIDTEENVYVLAKHGKSKNVAIWTLRNLAESNSQLNEFSPNRKCSDLKYYLPEGGIAGSHGLCNKAILIV